MFKNEIAGRHLVVQPVQVVQAVGDAGQVVGVLVVGRSGRVAVWWVDVWRHQHVSASGVKLRCHVTIVGPVKGRQVDFYEEGLLEDSLVGHSPSLLHSTGSCI